MINDASRSVRKAYSPRPSPQHALLTEKLLERVSSGHYPIGTLMPTEHELSAEFRLSRQTVREALRRLSELGLITRQRGIGTRVVRRTPQEKNLFSISSMAELDEYAEEARLEISSLDIGPVSEEDALLLQCSEGAHWLNLKGLRRRRTDDLPLGVATIRLRAWFPGVDEHLKRLEGSISAMLAREYDASIEEIQQETRAVILSSEEAALLGAKPGDPGLSVTRRYYLNAERLVLHGRIVYVADRFVLSSKLRKQ